MNGCYRRAAYGVQRRMVAASLLLASFLVAPVASQYVSVQGPPFASPSVSLGVPNATQVAANIAATLAAAFPFPSNVTITCALLVLDLVPGNVIGDGYAGFVMPLGQSLSTALAALTPGSLLPLNAADVDGFMVRVMNQLQTQVGFNLRYVLVYPPLSLLPPLNNNTDYTMLYAFQSMNVSCVLTPALMTPFRRMYMRQSVTLFTFGFQVVTTRPTFIVPSTLKRVFLWTLPFSPALWAILMASIIAPAIAMPLFERGGGDFDSKELHSFGERAGHAFYLASMSLSNPDAFEPTTAGARVAQSLHAFALLLIVTFYTANLAAQFTTADVPVQPVTSVNSFGPGLPVCLRASPILLDLLNTSYPAAFATITAPNTHIFTSQGSSNALQAVLNGDCAGAVLPATDSNWIMNVNDTTGNFCELVPVGDVLGEEAVPLTFALPGMVGGLTNEQLQSLNLVLAGFRSNGDYLSSMRSKFFPTQRLVCPAQDAADAAALATLAPATQLEPVDLAGAFLLQAIGLVLGFLLHTTKHHRKRASTAIVQGMPEAARRVFAGGSGGEEAPEETLKKETSSTKRVRYETLM